MKLTKQTVWVVTVVCDLKFAWTSSESNQRLTTVRVVAADTEKTARLKAVELVKMYWKQYFSESRLKTVEASWSYAVNISKGNNTELD
jgi:hypothetical protein